MDNSMRSETLTGTDRQNVFTHQDISDRSFWIGLGVIVAVGLLTRLLFLGRIYLWIDETPILAEALWDNWGGGLRGLLRGMRVLSFDVYRHQTYNGTWAALVFAICRTVGAPTAWWARLPSVLAGVLLLPAVAVLARRVSGSSLAGLVAAGATTTSIVQSHYAQQILPFAPTVLAVALVVWATMAWRDGFENMRRGLQWLPDGFLLFAAVAAAAMLHNCTLPVVAVCLVGLAGSVIWAGLRRRLARPDTVRRLASLAQAGLVVGLCMTVFTVPKLGQGYRSYLRPYYGPAQSELSDGALSRAATAARFGATRAYDLMTYALNPAYNDGLYRPLRLNPVAIVPVMLVLVGVAALCLPQGQGRTFVALAGGCVLLAFAGAMLRRYPFGGVRQCLPLTVFVYVLLGTGVSVVYRRSRPAALAMMSLWVVLWLAVLPDFYAKRLSPYDAGTLAGYAARSETRLFVTFNDRGWPEHAVLKYHLRNHPDIRVAPLPDVLDELRRRQEPFVLASVTRSLAKLRALCHTERNPVQKERLALAELLADERLRVTPLAEVAVNPVTPTEMQDDGQSIYTPLNGLFLYKVTWEAGSEGLSMALQGDKRGSLSHPLPQEAARPE